MFRDPARTPQWIAAWNSGSVAIPPFSVVEVTVEGALNLNNKAPVEWHGGAVSSGPYSNPETGITVRRPTASSLSSIAVNGETSIPSFGYGLVAVSGPVYVSHGIASPESAISPGSLLGTQANSFVLVDGVAPGFVVVGDFSGLNRSNQLVLVDFVRAAQMKQLARFTLGATLTGSASATLTNQYGPGTAHTTTSVTVHNLTDSSSGQVFSGASGAAGLAMWDSGTNWRIIQMECPA